MIQIDNKFAYEQFDVQTEIDVKFNAIQIDSEWFKGAFDWYLQQEYGISEEDFKRIIKNVAPEEFI